MTKAAQRTRLIIASPDDEARTFLRRRFTRLGYDVAEAARAADAVARLENALKYIV